MDNPQTFCEQVKRFWCNIGVFTKFMFLINLFSFIIQNGVMAYMFNETKEPNFDPVALCVTGVIDENQWYRLFSSEITHGSLGHILANMSMFLVWGTELEKHYGTLFYAAINLQLCLLSNLMSMGVSLFQTYYLKHTVFGYEIGGFDQLMKCAVGYSNILFGIMMLEALMGGERY